MDSIIFDWTMVLWGVLALLLSFALGTGVVAVVVATLPTTFLQASDIWPHGASAHPVLYWSARVGKNVIGLIVIAIGLILALPGVPGPGLPIVLLGLALIDFPGKRRLMQNLLRVPSVLGGINAFRMRLGRPPLVSPHPPHSLQVSQSDKGAAP